MGRTGRRRAGAATIIVAGALLWSGGVAAETAKVRVAGPLQAAPAISAASTGAVKAGASVEITARKGFWAQVRSGPSAGWLKLSRLSLAGRSSGDVAAVASGRTGSKNIVSASGGRGLDASDFAKATPAPAAVAALRRTEASETAAAQFATKAGLKTRRLDYVHEAKASASAGDEP